MTIKRFMIKQLRKCVIAMLPNDHPVATKNALYIRVSDRCYARIEGDYRNVSAEELDRLFKKTIADQKK